MFEAEQNIPLDLWVGLLCEYHIADGEDTGIFELPFANNYGRVPTNQMDWFTPDGITMYNASELVFPAVLYDWGRITHFGLWLSKEAANCICVGDLSSPKDIIRAALKYKQNDFAFWVNGTEVDSDSLGNVPTGLNVLSFDYAGGSPFYGKTKQVQYYDSALTDSDLETLTSWVSFSDMANGQLYTIQ